VNNTFWKRFGIYIFGALVLSVDGAYFDLFTLLLPYLAVEYLKFSGITSVLRVMIVLTIHSALCFKALNFLHIVIFAAYVLFIMVREYFLKPFFPFLLFNITIALLLVLEGSFWIMALVLMTLSLLIWRIDFEKA